MIPGDRLSGIRAFVQAAQAGGFSLAAEQLGQSRSTVGKAIARLEARLQVKLFLRTTRTLSLTSEGQRFYQDCLRILADLDAAENRLTAHASVPTGCLRVAAPPLFGEKQVLPLLLPLTRRWPGLTLDMHFSTRRVDLAESGIDLAVRIGSPGHHSDLTSRQLGVQQMQLCASPDYLQASGIPASFSELEKHRHITLPEQGRTQSWILKDSDGKPFWWQPEEGLRFSTLSAVYRAVLDGYGIAQLPQWLVDEHIRDGELIELLPQSQAQGLPISAVWLKTAAMPQRLRLAIDTLVAGFTPC
ncbi:LysR family transcriptional regulator [Pantoea coffeiphila]|uniref:LysR family transcriptional regulator n=1 Tax=Pantoea coffeiphila TaxID=1465635 RepID=A0A2S9IEM4_9GAMM|nr:LysR family transcriptional regulator [Pantoea coffeiphila]PRD16236.1 LysR family transcriptional regulator [Pantoea coffeiphila]